MILSNIASGACWSSPLYRFDHLNGNYTRLYNEQDSEQKVIGLASELIVFTSGRFQSRLIAIYYLRGDWLIFDGATQTRLSEINIERRTSDFVSSSILGCLTIKRDGIINKILYFRPLLRHLFEDGWAIDDIDIGCVIERLANDEAARSRLLRVFLGEY